MKPVKGIQHEYIRNARLAELIAAIPFVALVAAIAGLYLAITGHMPEII